jgi:predicted RecA/RadA family phage recombinase
MAEATFIHDGDVIDYTPTVDVPAGTVVKHGFWVGVAKQAIPANRRGSLAITGVFDIPKPANEAIVFAAGGDVYWNLANRIGFPSLLDPGDGFMGHAVEAAPNEANFVRVRLQISPNVNSS